MSYSVGGPSGAEPQFHHDTKVKKTPPHFHLNASKAKKPKKVEQHPLNTGNGSQNLPRPYGL